MTVLTRILNAPVLVRRSLAIGLAVIAVALASWVVFLALGSIETAKAEVDQKRETLGQLQAIVALAKTIDASAMPAPAGAQGEFLTGESEAVIRGGLQTRLNALAASNKVTVLSAGNAPALNEDGVSYLGLRANVSGSLEAVHGFMLNLETTLPVLFVREATLRTTNTSPTQTAEPEIFAEVLFYGALRTDDAAAPSGGKP